MSQPNATKLIMIEVIEDQLKENDSVKVKSTLNRLMSLGIRRQVAIEYIASALLVEIYAVVNHSENFDTQRYEKNLDNLPDLSWKNE